MDNWAVRGLWKTHVRSGRSCEKVGGDPGDCRYDADQQNAGRKQAPSGAVASTLGPSARRLRLRSRGRQSAASGDMASAGGAPVIPACSERMRGQPARAGQRANRPQAGRVPSQPQLRGGRGPAGRRPGRRGPSHRLRRRARAGPAARQAASRSAASGRSCRNCARGGAAGPRRRTAAGGLPPPPPPTPYAAASPSAIPAALRPGRHRPADAEGGRPAGPRPRHARAPSRSAGLGPADTERRSPPSAPIGRPAAVPPTAPGGAPRRAAATAVAVDATAAMRDSTIPSLWTRAALIGRCLPGERPPAAASTV